MKNRTVICITLVMVFCWFGEIANAQWLNSPYNNNAICTAALGQADPQLMEGYRNCVFVWQSLYLTTIGNGNSAFGTNSLSSNLAGNHHSTIGCDSLLVYIAGGSNSLVGINSLFLKRRNR